MKIIYNNKTLEYEITDNGKTLVSSGDALFGKKECEYKFLKEYLHLDEESIRAYDFYSVSYDNLDNIKGVDLFNHNEEHIRHIDTDEIESIVHDGSSFDSLLITEENIEKHYSSMQDEDLEKYSSIIDKKLRVERNPIIKNSLMNDLGYNGIRTKDETSKMLRSYISNDYNSEGTGIIRTAIFGVKDNLQPIDQFVSDIKDSASYKSYKKSLDSNRKLDNMVDTYSLMNNKDLQKYAVILDSMFTERQVKIMSELAPANEEDYLIEKTIKGSEVPQYSGEIKLHDLTVGQEIYGVQDNLQPFDDYLRQIKSSKNYQYFLEDNNVLGEKLSIQHINSISLTEPDEEVIKSLQSSIDSLEKELTYYPNDRAIMEQLANTLDELENEKNSQSFLIAYSSEYSETPSYDTFSKEEIQELFKDMSIEEFKYNIVPYLEGEELKKMIDTVYPSKNNNIAIQDGLEAIIVDDEDIIINTDEIREYLLSEYHKAGVKNLQIDAVMGAIKDSIQEAIKEKNYSEEIRISKNIGISVGLDNGKVHLGIDREELLASKTFENVITAPSIEHNNEFANTDIITVQEKNDTSMLDLKNAKNDILASVDNNLSNSVELKSSEALKTYILNSNSHNISDLLTTIEDNFGDEYKETFLESFNNYTDDPLDSYYQSSVLVSIFSDDLNNLADELGENEEKDNHASLKV